IGRSPLWPRPRLFEAIRRDRFFHPRRRRGHVPGRQENRAPRNRKNADDQNQAHDEPHGNSLLEKKTCPAAPHRSA
ncbi:MAG: hypothetical protein AB7D00_10865, partial [Rhodospirillaceae bacterium]